MSYFGELRAYWRAVLAAAMGLSAGFALQNYAGSLFVPALMAEFKWSKEDYALIGLTATIAIFTLPVAGRIVDLAGVRRTATLGVIGVPTMFFLFSLQGGDIRQYFGLVCIFTIVGALTTAAVYSRMVVEFFAEARGTALALAVCGPALVAALGTPFLADVIEEHGWRTGYRALAAFSRVMGVAALLIVPRLKKPLQAEKEKTPLINRIFNDYPAIFRQRAFWLIVGGMVLVNVPQVLQTYHMTLVLAEQGALPATIALILSTYATGVIVGRLVSGLALDRFPAHIVAAIAMAMPAIGLFLLASNQDATPVLFVAVGLMGLSQGAESDVGGYLVVRHFGLKVYGSVYGLMICAMGGITVITSLILSKLLAITDSFAIFIGFSGIAVLLGASLFLFLGSAKRHEQEAELQPAEATTESRKSPIGSRASIGYCDRRLAGWSNCASPLRTAS